jgi:hypothetical protein
VRLPSGGVTMRGGASGSILALCCRSQIGLVLGCALKIMSMGTRITSIDDLIGKATSARKTQAPERDGKAMPRLDRSIKKNALIISAISTPRYAVGTVPG